MTTQDYRTRSPLRIFLSYFKPHRRLFALDMTCAFLIACIDLAFPLVSRAATYSWLPQRQFRTFFIVMAVVVAAYLLRSGLYFVVAYWGHTFGIRVEADIRRDLYHHIQELGFDFYDRNRTGQLMSRLTSDLFELTELAHHGPEDLFISAVTILGALAVMFCLRWELALVLLLLLPVLLASLLSPLLLQLPAHQSVLLPLLHLLFLLPLLSLQNGHYQKRYLPLVPFRYSVMPCLPEMRYIRHKKPAYPKPYSKLVLLW